MLSKISKSQFAEFLKDYYMGAHEGLRLGQAFMESFYPEVKDKDVYKETQPTLVVDWITQKYVQP